MTPSNAHMNSAQPIDSSPVDSFPLSSPTRPVVANHLRRRALRLSQAVPAIECIVRYNRRWGLLIPEAVWPLYASAMVELYQIRGELGVTDGTHIERLADTIGSDETARALWADKKAVAEANAAHNYARAHHKLTHTGAAKVWHETLVDLMEVSAAFGLRASTKREIFSKGTETGLPTVKGPAPVPSWRRPKVQYTAEQRKDWCRRLGFAPGTLADNARTLSEAEFHARIAKREADLLPPSRLEGKKLPGESDWQASKRIPKEGPKTRKRAPCLTSERRDLAAELGVHPDTVKKKTKGMTMEKIHALRGDPARAFCILGLSTRGRSTPDEHVRSTPDKSQEIGHFPLEDVTDHASPKGSAQNENGHPVTASIPARKASRNERGPYAYSYAYGVEEGEIIHRCYEAKRGLELTEEAARKWHVRDTFERKFFEACEWIIAQNIPNDEDDLDQLRSCAEFWLKAYREQDRKRRASRRNSKLMPAWMRAYIRKIEEGVETMVETFPANAEPAAAA